MKKVLYISNVLAHINSFHIPYILMLKQYGYEVDVIANSCGETPRDCFDRYYDIAIERSPFSLKNISAYKKIKKVINDNKYDLIHVHTPMGGVLGRLAARDTRKTGTKVIYTSHGFHFYEGAPLFNKFFYFNVEKYLSRYCDGIILINNEDLTAAQKFVPDNCSVFYMDGVGVDLHRYCRKDKEQQLFYKKKFGYENRTVILYAAEFIERKNHRFLIDAFAEIAKIHTDAVLLLAGKGALQSEMYDLTAKRGLSQRIHFLGYRRDIPELLGMADVTVSTSRQEGFPINVAESIASGVPAVVSDIRGNIDIIENGINGFVFKKNDTADFVNKVSALISDDELRQTMSKNCANTAKRIDIDHLVPIMKSIYSNFITLTEE